MLRELARATHCTYLTPDSTRFWSRYDMDMSLAAVVQSIMLREVLSHARFHYSAQSVVPCS
ncbi:hypothetical protein CHELA20_51225 [Hyphomicrobiales bacterium]|nr:hypothetical protein CHELA41_23787 [Hyphomicrobiales bacterium]CAH1674564.1 hypothetical protein CHELA20_51225 [Hyphomicrobiales bacterium]